MPQSSASRFSRRALGSFTLLAALGCGGIVSSDVIRYGSAVRYGDGHNYGDAQ
jgi:hypothetical protein